MSDEAKSQLEKEYKALEQLVVSELLFELAESLAPILVDGFELVTYEGGDFTRYRVVGSVFYHEYKSGDNWLPIITVNASKDIAHYLPYRVLNMIKTRKDTTP